MRFWSLVLAFGAAPALAADKPSRPPIDVAAPAKVETATFAVG